jgi:CRISPR/Cas system-associated endoribonuclease Cas2
VQVDGVFDILQESVFMVELTKTSETDILKVKKKERNKIKKK